MQAKQREKYTLETADYDEAMNFLNEHQCLLEDAGFIIKNMSFLSYNYLNEDAVTIKQHEVYVEGERDYKKD